MTRFTPSPRPRDRVDCATVRARRSRRASARSRRRVSPRCASSRVATRKNDSKNRSPWAPRGAHGPGVYHLRPHAGVCAHHVGQSQRDARFGDSIPRRSSARPRARSRDVDARARSSVFFCVVFRRDMSTFETFQGGAHVDLFDAKTHRRATMTRGSTRSSSSSSSTTTSRAMWCGRGGTTYDALARGYVARVRGRALTRGEDGRAIGATQPIVCAQVRAGGRGRAFRWRCACETPGRREDDWCSARRSRTCGRRRCTVRCR